MVSEQGLFILALPVLASFLLTLLILSKLSGRRSVNIELSAFGLSLRVCSRAGAGDESAGGSESEHEPAFKESDV